MVINNNNYALVLQRGPLEWDYEWSQCVAAFFFLVFSFFGVMFGHRQDSLCQLSSRRSVFLSFSLTAAGSGGSPPSIKKTKNYGGLVLGWTSRKRKKKQKEKEKTEWSRDNIETEGGTLFFFHVSNVLALELIFLFSVYHCNSDTMSVWLVAQGCGRWWKNRSGANCCSPFSLPSYMCWWSSVGKWWDE